MLAPRYYGVGLRRTIRRYLWNALIAINGGHRPHQCLLLEGSQSASYEELQNRILRARRGEVRSPGAFVLRFNGPVLVEPKYGWAISGRGCLEDLSLTYGWQTHAWKGREWVGLPSPVRTLRTQLSRTSPGEIAQAVSVVSPWPENYFHFLTDVLPKLLAYERAGLPADLPVLVSGELAATRFFQEARRHGELSKREFVPVGGSAVRVRELYVAQGPELDATTTRELLSLLDHKASEQIPGNRIFVTRSARRGRTIANFPDLVPAIRAAGFRIVDLDEASFEEQMRLFSSLELLAGIHGAGLVNLLFSCGRPLPVFEVVPHGLDAEMDYFRALCEQLGFPFRRVHGNPAIFRDKRASFSVDPERFRVALSRFVEESAGSSLAMADAWS